MRFGLLGPLLVHNGTTALSVSTPKCRLLLGTMLLRPNRRVPVDTLYAALWGEHPPPTASASLHNHIGRLRRMLGPGAGTRLSSMPPGYVFRIEDGELDTDVFTDHVHRARTARLRRDWESVRVESTAALSLWRGEPLADLPTLAERHTRIRVFKEAHLQALEWRFDADLNMGRHHGLATELAHWTAKYPLREAFHRQLMLALHRTDRRAEALDVYQRLRRTLIDELGIEPGSMVQDAHQKILRSDAPAQSRWRMPATTSSAPPTTSHRSVAPADPLPAAGPADPASSHPAAPATASTADSPAKSPATATWPTPAQLPADIPDFTGRKAQVKHVCELLTSSQKSDAPSAVAVTAICGTGGVGKTTLAVHTAHRLAPRFPDGQLYVNLRGTDARPRSPQEVLASFLRDLGVPDDAIPPDEETQAARYRTLTAGRRLLIVLDNARDSAQVRPLLPGTGSCGVLVTSRHRLPGLAAAAHITVDVLDDTEARALFTAVVGPERAAAEPEATTAVLTCCAGLPLAVRIAAARLAARPSWTVASLADRLRDVRRRLDELCVEDVAVRTSLQVSYASLPAPSGPGDIDAARTFRLLGLLNGPDIGLHAAAALLGQTPERAEQVLELLVNACLLDTHLPGRYRLHDLLRVYAAERVMEEEPDHSRRDAVERMAHWCLVTLAAADKALLPQVRRPKTPAPDPAHPPLTFDTFTEALQWCNDERATLVGAAEAAASYDLHHIAWQIPSIAWSYFRLCARHEEWLRCNEIGMRSALLLGDRSAQSYLLNSHAGLLFQLHQLDEAESCLTSGLQIVRETGDETGEMSALTNLAIIYRSRRQYQQSREHSLQALALARSTGRKTAEANVLNNLGTCEDHLGNYAEALTFLQSALDIYHQVDDSDGVGVALANIGAVHLHRRSLSEALVWLQQALPLARAVGNRINEAETLTHLGETLAGLNRPKEARHHLNQARSLWLALADPRANHTDTLLSALSE
ncbi:AfsR/SARP family transcriptional regulator [Microtetraspora malaysiensis]|uniref:AfsR/SARP family transcriptional regulator n=1 Tax=Microtetraspora malaysiensis TaxID=161358 RepID=UPI003D902C4F